MEIEFVKNEKNNNNYFREEALKLKNWNRKKLTYFTVLDIMH